jgi:UDP-glucuronate 4-epimerase
MTTAAYAEVPARLPAEAGRSVVVTGAAGFIGSHVTETLLGLGFPVVGIDHCQGHPRQVWERNLEPALAHPRFQLVRGDLAQIPLEPLLAGADTVFHLAARPGVRTSWGAEFGGYVTSNVLGTHRLLEAASAAGVRRAVVSSSSSVYGLAPEGPLGEHLLPSPLSPYGVTKLAAEQLAMVHARRPGSRLSVVALRYFTVYGPRQRPDMAIDRMIRSALTGEPVTIYGDGHQRRDFTFVDDAVRANLLGMTADVEAAVVNVGTGTTTSVLDLVDLVGEAVGRPVVVRHGRSGAGDVRSTWADLSRSAELLGYRPTVDLRTGVARQLAWLRETDLALHDSSEMVSQEQPVVGPALAPSASRPR